jgi:hypothetical protein
MFGERAKKAAVGAETARNAFLAEIRRVMNFPELDQDTCHGRLEAFCVSL